MPEKDEVDRLLDSALATYADPGADSGLERRVLAALAAERTAGEDRRAAGWSRRWLAWAIAAPVTASLLLWISIAKIKHAPPSQSQEAHRTERMQTPSVGTPAARARRDTQIGIHPSGGEALVHSSAHKATLKPCHVTKPVSLHGVGTGSTSCPTMGQDVSTGAQVAQVLPRPKLDVFPTPQPMTKQERTLAAVASEAPVTLRKALVEAQEQDDTRVRIAAIHIPPIKPPSQTQP